MQAEYNIKVTWLPFELHPEIPLEGWQVSVNSIKNFDDASDFLRTEANENGLKMIVPDMIPNSRRALEAAEYAREQDKHLEYHELTFRKYYEDGEDIGSWDVLRDIAEEIGINANEMQANTEKKMYDSLVSMHKQQAVSMGVKGVPVYIFDNKYVVMGLRPFSAFQEVMGQLQKESDLVE